MRLNTARSMWERKGGTKVKIIIVAGILLSLMSMACVAAENPKVSLSAKDMPIADAAADLAKQASVQIVCDSNVKASVTGSFQSIDLEKLLDAVTKSNGLTWQKLYLPTDAEQKPILEQVKARAEAVAAISGGPIVICDPVTGKQKVFVEQSSATPTVEPDKLGLKPVYLISKPKSETSADKSKDQDLGKQLQSLEQERLKLLAKMTPEQRVAAAQQQMLSQMSLTPEMRQQTFLDQMKARQSMDPQMQQQYRQMMRDTFTALREQGLIPQGGGWRGGGGRNRGGNNN